MTRLGSHYTIACIVTVYEAKVLLQDLGNIFNQLSAAHDGQRWFWETIGLEDATTLLKGMLNYENTTVGGPATR